MLMEIALVKLGYNVVDKIIMNEIIVKIPSATLTKLQEIVHLEESWKNRIALSLKIMEKPAKGKKKGQNGPFCAPGKHNPEATSHNADHCWQLHPKLRPPNGRKFFGESSSQPPTTKLVEVNKGHESEVSIFLKKETSKPIVLDSGATHHLINNPDVFHSTAKSNIKIATGGHSNFLNATAVRTAILTSMSAVFFIPNNKVLKEQI
ncbi:hypothetical protein VP01_2453g5 [Puccinia sorghi]|uniref:Uncharacterized protein n=1 Tax=Puccinia sorghi TaxID=27349 RepID=A0A0L6V7Z6_9BASI|nr:hypothetical protein VP01_2453g5 [Puccinia sorghi]